MVDDGLRREWFTAEWLVEVLLLMLSVVGAKWEVGLECGNVAYLGFAGRCR